MARKDLTGQKFNRWTVLHIDEERTDRKTYWICQCECGNIKSVRSDGLTGGRSKSCGCLNNELRAKRMREIGKNQTIKYDLTGQDFGYWHVDSRAENQNNHVAWNCTCKCGTKRIVLGQSLKSGASKSCGCLTISHGELEIKNLLEKYGLGYIREYQIQDLYFKSTKHKTRFDFFVTDEFNEYMIEFDGEQHFKDLSEKNFFKHDIETIKERDSLKNEWCKKHNFPLIRIPYTQLGKITIEDLMLETTKWRVV